MFNNQMQQPGYQLSRPQQSQPPQQMASRSNYGIQRPQGSFAQQSGIGAGGTSSAMNAMNQQQAVSGQQPQHQPWESMFGGSQAGSGSISNQAAAQGLGSNTGGMGSMGSSGEGQPWGAQGGQQPMGGQQPQPQHQPWESMFGGSQAGGQSTNNQSAAQGLGSNAGGMGSLQSGGSGQAWGSPQQSGLGSMQSGDGFGSMQSGGGGQAWGAPQSQGAQQPNYGIHPQTGWQANRGGYGQFGQSGGWQRNSPNQGASPQGPQAGQMPQQQTMY